MTGVHICFDARTADAGFPGIGRYALNLVRALAPLLEAGDRLHVLRPPSGNASEQLAAIEGPNCDSQIISASTLSPLQQWVVPRAIRKAGVNVYHSAYIGMPLRVGVPTVLTIHDLIPLRLPHSVSAWKRPIFKALVRRAARAADAIIAPTECTASDVSSELGVASNRIHMIPYAAGLGRSQPIAPTKSESADFALCVGTARPHKNHVRLVEAWSKVRSPYELVMAGFNNTATCGAAQRSRELGIADRVRFVGRVDDATLSALYRDARLVVLPSEMEGFGLPVLEAMASSAPVACSDISVLREVAGNAAAFFPPYDVDAMAGVLDSLIGDEAGLDQLRRAGESHAAKFSWQRTAQATIEVYRSLVS